MDINKNKEVKQPQFVKCCSLVNFKKIVKKKPSKQPFESTVRRKSKASKSDSKAHRKDRITCENISLSKSQKK